MSALGPSTFATLFQQDQGLRKHVAHTLRQLKYVQRVSLSRKHPCTDLMLTIFTDLSDTHREKIYEDVCDVIVNTVRTYSNEYNYINFKTVECHIQVICESET